MALRLNASPDEQSSKRSAAKKAKTLRLGGSRKPGATDRMFFTEQLALLLETGENLFGALTTIVKQTENPRMQTVVQQLAADISEGHSFRHALAQHEDIFSSTYVNLIDASETGGFMHEVLQQLLDMDRKREALRTAMVSAATYPAFLLVFSLAVVVFVLVVVFPKFGAMFTSIYDQLPMSTKALMSTSAILREYWWLILSALAGFTFVFRRWLKSPAGQVRIDQLQLRLPVVRDIFVQVYLVQCLQVFSLSLINGVSVMDTLNACKDVVRNSVFRDLMSSIERSVQAGAGVAAGFAESDVLPDLAKHMIATGEQTGNLGKVMGRVAEYYETQLSKKLNAVSKLAEPLMLLVMGVVVGILVSSLILPIFKLSRAVS